MFVQTVAVMAGLAAMLPLSAMAQDKSAYDVLVAHDVTYGQAPVGVSPSGSGERPLTLDVYRPASGGKALADRPAIIMAFGGSFHQGDKGEKRFAEGGAEASSMADYCRTFARAGYVCFSIDYRLTQEKPALAHPPAEKDRIAKALNLSPVATARIEVVRKRLGLPPLDEQTREDYWHSIFAATEDMAMATAYVRAHADDYGIDGGRLALGGWSAGAITALNTAYGLGVPVKAVVSISGAISGYNLFETARTGMPPALFFVGQYDLDGIQSGTRFAAAALSGKSIPHEIAWVPGFGHFYPLGAVSLGDKVSRMPIATRILAFLDSQLVKAP